MGAQDPAGWFDQFPPATDGWTHEQWCWRHWAPCPVFGANGIAASLMAMTRIVDLMPAEITDTDQRNRWMRDLGLLCCTLGDAAMYEIWGKCPPSAPEAVSADA